MAVVFEKKIEELFALFSALNIAHTNHFHEPAFTVADSMHLHEDIPGGHGKSLFLKNKKNEYFLIVMYYDYKVNMKGLSQLLGKGALSFASPERLKVILDLEPGHVTPFAVFQDTQQQVGVYLDKKLLDYEVVNFHPLRNDITTTIKTDDLLRFLKHVHHEAQIIELPVC